MLNYLVIIEEFLKENFEPSNPESSNVNFTTEQLLSFLFRTFPEGCISDYDLNDILISLNYRRFTYVVESYHTVEKDDSEIYEIRKQLTIGWCLKSPFDLHTQEVEKI
ncbi:hypothetical protein [Flavobacterium sp. F52]|uniref:hypothetical protein n=1 Tax=Flavobacterium sp. F52 TaxID=1202532 RepID=UPI000272DFD1|nr:hypothetical protein [Flavobacterium sp. F52]EJG02281.1 hypothetical protein FF52_06360 [Flavobacterium sp. F52]